MHIAHLRLKRHTCSTATLSAPRASARSQHVLKHLALVLSCLLVGCQSTGFLDSHKPDRADLRYAAARQAVIVASPKPRIPENLSDFLRMGNHETGYTGGSATPISADGYFLTAEHIIARAKNKPLHVLFRRDAYQVQAPARLVWKNHCHDLALVHVATATPQFFRFSNGERSLPQNSPIIHTGANSGLKSIDGATSSLLHNDCSSCNSQKIFINLPLKAGDSGGAILNSRCELIAICSGVEYVRFIETPIFANSHGNRPDPAFIEKLIQEDRRRLHH